MLDRHLLAGTVQFVQYRRTFTRLAAAAAVVLLSGCETRISTRIDVRSDATAVVRTSVRFDGAIAEKLESDTQLRTQFEAQLRTRGLEFEHDASTMTYTTTLRGDAIGNMGALTGVAGVRIERRDDGTAAVLVATQRPVQLEAALIESVRNEPDRAALAVTAAENTFLRIDVVYPGPVLSADSGQVDGNTVSYEEQLADWPEGVLSTVGSLRRDTSLPWRWIIAGCASLAAVLWVGVRRRR